ncbi:Sodium-coupled monocarboxylate transporter 1 [Armadillidium vulgare]|nr:Sodium-coupled monocarboxylate transporter 1 [Armadillidium vulgare]
MYVYNGVYIVKRFCSYHQFDNDQSLFVDTDYKETRSGFSSKGMIHGDGSSKFGIVDYCVFAAMFIFTIAIGVYTTFKGNKSPEEFLMGNRSFKPLAVAMSLLTSYVSAIRITGEIYAHGMQYSIILLGITLSIVFAIYFVLPILYPLKLTSVNEFIELRFKSKRLRTLISFMSLLKSLLHMSFLLYAPTIALASLTNLSISFYIFSLGIICTIYSAFGGIRAVIWTDTFQLSVMLIGAALVVAIGCIHFGGLINILYVSSKGGRLEMFDMRINPIPRTSFFNCLAGGFFAYGMVYCSDQMYVQRVCAVKSIEDATTSLSSVINSCVAMIWSDVCLPLITGSLITGLAVFASYSHSLIDISGSVTMPFQGSVFGIFLIGYFYPKCNLIRNLGRLYIISW